MFKQRRKTRPVWVGGLQIGGGAPVSVQSMTNTDTGNVEATVAQINELAAAGCELVRVAVPDWRAVNALYSIKKQVKIPLVADIHFQYRLALGALEAGVDGIRINPGNIGGEDRVAAIVKAAKKRKVPIRIGVNAGSCAPELLQKYGSPSAEALVESALREIRRLEELDFFEIKVSVKASDVSLMVAANQMLAEKVDYPFHVGVTEAGLARWGAVKSAVGIGILLAVGIGDTIRVSLTADPIEEVHAGYAILRALGLRKKGVELISCPTCGRTEVNLLKIAAEVEERLKYITAPLKVAVMGCAVNGPGEAKHADVGIACGKGGGVLFRGGKVIRRVPEESLVEELVKEVEEVAKDKPPALSSSPR